MLEMHGNQLAHNASPWVEINGKEKSGFNCYKCVIVAT